MSSLAMELRVTASRALVIVALALALAGCAPGEVVNPDAFLAELGGYHTSSDFAPASARPFASELDPFPEVQLWVSAEAAAAYARIAPDQDGSGVVLPPGTIIVREVLGADGGVAKLTVMGKGPPGYNPAIGDWWFAVTAPDGTPLAADDGTPLVGRLEKCVMCHEDRAADDHLFGVPGTAR
jgi:hypothetical protein